MKRLNPTDYKKMWNDLKLMLKEESRENYSLINKSIMFAYLDLMNVMEEQHLNDKE